ncbi:MAG: ATP-dependent 6-phosphofructokinase, partial [Deltaproteobacteria bacterium]|nr:ATP-dependent 6-phosphofructokinase [Deltaproteobacteria bacterium]
MLTQRDLIVATLGPCQFESPLEAKGRMFADESIRVRVKRHVGEDASEADALSFEEAGPRHKLFFDPA